MEILINLPSIITFIFLLTILSYYVLFFIKQRKIKIIHKFTGITIIIPAHNEGEYIKKSIESVIEADFDSFKQIIVVDDGSIDNTYEIASKFKSVKVIKEGDDDESGFNSNIKYAEHRHLWMCEK